MKRNIQILVILGLIFLLVAACTRKGQYRTMVDEGIASGVRHDSLFLGLYLGMPSKEFYGRCWKLNEQGILKNGAQNLSAQYTLYDRRDTMYLNFYPDFFQDKISDMPVRFNYKTWAPWNKELFADSLLLDVVDLMEEWYGEGFVKFSDPEKGEVYVKVDGNRRIMLHTKDDQYVEGWLTDMELKERLKKQKEEAKKPKKEAS